MRCLILPAIGLLKAYGLDCYCDTDDDKLLLKVGYQQRLYSDLAYGDGLKVKVIDSHDLAKEIEAETEKVLQSYK